MEQVNIKTNEQALIISTAAIDGTRRHEVALEITRNTSAKFEAEQAALVASRKVHEQAKEALRQQRILRDTLLEAARVFAMLARNVWRPHFGNKYSERWTEAGFQGSLQIPLPPDKVILLLESMREFLAKNPSFEVAGLEVTALHLKEKHAALLAAQNAVKRGDVRVKTLQGARDDKFKILRKRIRHLVKELAQILDPNDVLWLDFGLKIPGAKQTPPAPENVTVLPITDTSMAVKWERTPRAEYYRVRTKVEGIDTELKWIGSPTDPAFTLEEIPADKAVEISIAAVNRTGESVWSEVVIVRSRVGNNAG